MIHTIAIIKGTGIMTGIAFASITLGLLADVLSNDTPITLGGAMAVGGVVVGGVWYLSSRLQRIDDRLKSIERNCVMCKKDKES